MYYVHVKHIATQDTVLHTNSVSSHHQVTHFINLCGGMTLVAVNFVGNNVMILKTATKNITQTAKYAHSCDGGA